MALYNSLLRSIKVNSIRCCVFGVWTKSASNKGNSGDISVEFDLIDEFTTQLVQSKSEKWAKRSLKTNLTKQMNSPQTSSVTVESSVDIHNLHIEDINKMFDNYLQDEDYASAIRLMNECIRCKKCPKFSVLNVVLNYCSLKGERELILQIQALCEELQPSVLEMSGKGYFNMFLATAIWVRGDIIKSLTLFKEVYRETTYLRRKVRLSLQNFIGEAVTCRSEAVLQNLLDFCEHLQNEFDDLYPLRCLWQSCFLSEWFSDQEIAIQLLERNDNLYDSISNRIPYLITICLKNDKLEVVHRLLEYLLKNDKRAETRGLLILLFDYHLKRKDISSCSTIMQWCRENNVRIPGVHSSKFFNLLMSNNSSTKMSVDEEEKEEKPPPKYDFKF